MKNVLIVTYYWPPSGGAGVQRWLKLCNYLLELDVQPWVVTVTSDKATYPVRDQTLLQEVDPRIRVITTDTLEPFGIYQRLSGKKQIPFGGFADSESQRISFKQKFARFVRGNVFLPDARRGWNRYALKACVQLLQEHTFDAVITTSPPHSTQLIGRKLKRQFGLTWIADMRDPWTDIYYYNKLYLTAFSKARDARMERNVLQDADAVVVVSAGVRDLLTCKLPAAAAEKFHIIPNGYDPRDFEQEPLVPQERFIISYTGTLSDDYRLDALLGAWPLLQQAGVPLALHITGSIAGGMRERITTIAGEQVIWKPQIAHKAAVQQMQNASVLLLIIPETPGNKGILTGKLFEYLAAHRPVLCIGPINGDAAAIIRECEAGVAVDYGDVDTTTQFLLQQLENWKKHRNPITGNDTVMQYSRLHQARQFLGLVNTARKSD